MSRSLRHGQRSLPRTSRSSRCRWSTRVGLRRRLRGALDYLPVAARQRAHLVGHVEEVGDLLSAADVFVFPSLHEGLGGALLEALAMSLPIVASDLAAFREFLVPGEHAILVPPGCVAALAQATVRLLADDSLRSRMGAASLELFEQRFQMESVADDTERLYRKLAVSRPMVS